MATPAQKAARERAWQIHQLKMMATMARYFSPKRGAILTTLISEELAELKAKKK